MGNVQSTRAEQNATAPSRQPKIKHPPSEKGYTLHDRRIAAAGGDKAIRSIKYEVVFADQDRQRVIEAIRADHLAINGPVNFRDFVRHEIEGTPRKVSFVEAWFAMLRAGAVFQPATGALTNLAARVRGGSPLKKFRDTFRPLLIAEYAELIDWAELFDFVSKGTRDTTNGQMGGKILRCFSADAKESTDPATVAIIKRAMDSFERVYPLIRVFKGDGEAKKRHELRQKIAIFLKEPPPAEDGRGAASVAIQDSPTVLLARGPGVPAAASRMITATAIEKTLSEIEGWASALSAGDVEEEAANALSLSTLLGLGGAGFSSLANFGNDFLPGLADQTKLPNLAATQAALLGQDAAGLAQRLAAVQASLGDVDWNMQLANGPGDYRTDIGGKLQSWLSNRDRCRKELATALDELLVELQDKAAVLLEHYSDATKVGQEVARWAARTTVVKAAVTGLTTRIPLAKGAIEQNQENAQELLDLLADDIAALNQELNEWFQVVVESRRRQGPPAGRRSRSPGGRRGEASFSVEWFESRPADELDFRKIFKQLSKRLQRIPLFLGLQQQRTYVKAYWAPRLVRVLHNFLLADLKALKEGATPSALSAPEKQRVLAWWRKVRDQCIGAEQARFARMVGAAAPLHPFQKVPDDAVIYKNPRSRARVRVLAESDHPALGSHDIIDWLLENLSLGLPALTQHGWDLYLALVELAKSFIPILLERSSAIDRRIDAARLAVDVEGRWWGPAPFEKLKVALALRGGETGALSTQDYQYLVNLLCTELRGLVGILSRKEITQNYTLQSINGSQSDLLVAAAQAVDVAPDKARFMLHLPRLLRGAAAEPTPPLLRWIKGNESTVIVPTAPRGVVGEIRSSKYQVQFLRWALAKNLEKRWGKKRCQLEVSGTSLVLEERVPLKLDWSTERLTPLHDQVTSRIFSVVPFSFIPPTSQEGLLPISSNRFIGVDVGEFALCYSGIEVAGDKGSADVKVLGSGVIFDPQLRKLSKRVRELREAQRGGNFSYRSTRVARLRESLISSLRSRLHAVLLRYGATLVFEFDISAFEVGGNRIAKVYDSVKRTDTIPDNDAEKAERKHCWGRTNFRSGAEVGARGTSQTCTKCGRWAKAHVKEHLSGPAIKASALVREDSNVYAAKVGAASLRLFLKQPPGPEALLDEGALTTAIHDYMRPPLAQASAQIGDPVAAAAIRGNSSFFRCPFADCNHVADADLQAAFNIAMKGACAQLWKHKGDDWLLQFAAEGRPAVGIDSKDYAWPKGS